MSGITSFPRNLMTRLAHGAARRRNSRYARKKPWGAAPTEFIFYPQNRTIGSFRKGQELLKGKVALVGYELELGKASLWDAVCPSPAFEERLHRFTWLDDLAAEGAPAAQKQAQEWVVEWMHRYLQGSGPGWQPYFAGSRLLRLIIHSRFLMRGMEEKMRSRLFMGLWKHICYLSEQAMTAPAGIARTEALTGLIHATLSLDGQDDRLTSAVADLGRECEAMVDKDGAVPTRNPEELLENFARIVWCANALNEAGKQADPRIPQAVGLIAPVLRNLRMGDGSLARFHGGSSGRAGHLDQALADSGIRATSRDAHAMGYARLGGGRVTAIMDSAPPPIGAASVRAHASPLAIEVTSGRRTIITNTGPGAGFGAEWAKACRQTALHSTLVIQNQPSVTISPPETAGAPELILTAPTVTLDRGSDSDGAWLEASHNGYLARFGLLHQRKVFIATQGQSIDGEDRIHAPDRAASNRFRKAAHAGKGIGLGVAIHFHLHPEVTVDTLPGHNAANLILKSGEVWEFRQSGAELKIEKSAFLQPGNRAPIPSLQIVLRTRVTESDYLINWTLFRPVQSDQALRDLVVDDPRAS